MLVAPAWKLAVWVSCRSTSLKLTVPLAVSESVADGVVVASSVTVPACAALVMVGASFVPVTVQVTEVGVEFTPSVTL